MSQNPEMPLPVDSTPSLTTCSNCRSAMPSELRFCRNCGFRLGDGLAEYNETTRFGDQQGPLVPGSVSAPMPVKRRRKMSGMAWVFIALLVFFVGAAAFTAIISPVRSRMTNIHIASAKQSYTGTDGWENVEAGPGVTFDSVSLPDGPADKAGLVGGDVIMNFDGKPVMNKDDMEKIMEQMPPGKTVEVTYMRDGEVRNTKLTTISQAEFKQLENAFDDRPEGRGVFGYDSDDVERVEIPGTKMFGVRLDEVYPSRPADLAGVKKGDIVIEFDGTPIRTGQELSMRVNRALPYSTIKLVVMRGGDKLEKVEIPVKMGRR
jgi:C-terminal processing protease CtpA/Prc